MWPKGGPRLAWTFEHTGIGYSGPAVVGDRLYILGARKDDTFLFCLDATSGKEQWKAKIGPTFDPKNNFGGGPRATPTVADGLVYALNGDGDLYCFKEDKGEQVWRQR